MSKPGDQQEEPTELLVTVLARLCVLQGAVDALIAALIAGELAGKKDQLLGFKEWLFRVHTHAIDARVGYLTEQFPRLRKLIEDDVQVGQRTTRDIFGALEDKFGDQELKRNG